MADEKAPGGDKPATGVQEKPLNPTEQMHKFALDQVAYFKKINREEREGRLAAAKKEADEIRAKAARKHSQEPPREETADEEPANASEPATA